MVGGLGRQKLGVYSYAHMLIFSLKLLCEHLFTFQFCALMPKISKENFAKKSKKMKNPKKSQKFRRKKRRKKKKKKKKKKIKKKLT